MFRIVEAHKMSDGRAVDAVKLTFFHESVAREWKRVFLDIGCQVWFLAKSGDLVRLAE